MVACVYLQLCSTAEKTVIDKIIDHGPQPAGDMDLSVVNSLYRKGLIYLDVTIDDNDCIIGKQYPFSSFFLLS